MTEHNTHISKPPVSRSQTIWFFEAIVQHNSMSPASKYESRTPPRVHYALHSIMETRRRTISRAKSRSSISVLFSDSLPVAFASLVQHPHAGAVNVMRPDEFSNRKIKNAILYHGNIYIYIVSACVITAKIFYVHTHVFVTNVLDD